MASRQLEDAEALVTFGSAWLELDYLDQAAHGLGVEDAWSRLRPR
jgi:hypothetical protein